MPRIDTFTIPVFLDSIPVEIPRPAEILTRPGMAAASVLFYSPQFAPITIRTVSTAPDKTSAYNLADKYLKLIRRRVLVDDGMIQVPSTVVIAVRSFFADIGLAIGGNGTGDRFEVATTWTLLLDADLDTR